MMFLLKLVDFYFIGVISVFLSGLIIFLALFFITAPYGRHKRSETRSGLNPRMGWLIMELPSVVLFGLIFFIGDGSDNMPALLLFSLWELHYVHRTFIYSSLLRSKTLMPISIVVMGFVYNIINSSLNGLALTHLSQNYLTTWFLDPRLFVGVVIFLLGFIINLHSDHILRNLRGPFETGYKIPTGGLFKFVTSPNYFGEIVEWCGWALASWSLAGAAFAFFTCANLIPRARAHHRWYLKNFPEYPKTRKAVIPWIF
jgi:protein-S-isoprenylcysteine O-methyltransferase Ste14